MTDCECLTVDAQQLVSFTYMSVACLVTGSEEAEIAAIVERARKSNRARNVTGALLFTGRRFVQTLEGERPTIEALLEAIRLDRRHTQLLVIDERDIERRTFPRWTMAYTGPSVFVSRSLEGALVPWHPFYRDAVQRLLSLVVEFARQPDEPSGLWS